MRSIEYSANSAATKPSRARRLTAWSGAGLGILAMAACGAFPGHGNTSGKAPQGASKPPEASASGATGQLNPAAVPVGKVILDGTNFCAWDLDHPEPLVSANPPVVQVDGRCNTPEGTPDPTNPNDDKPVSIYMQPKYRGGNIGVAPNGVKDTTQLAVEACVIGDTIYDDRQRSSAVWFQTYLGGDLGFIPQVNAGWDQPYLHALGVPGC